MAVSFRLSALLRRPALAAASLAAVYLLGGTLYILLSGRIASSLATSSAELEGIERVKGIAFIAVTGALLFAAAWIGLRLLERERRRLTDLEWALVHEGARQLPMVLAASLANELKNLLQVAILQSSELASSSASAQTVASTREIEESLRRLAELGDRMHLLAQESAGRPQKKLFALSPLLDDIADLAAVHTQVRIRGLDRRTTTHAFLEGNTTILALAIFNLILHAASSARAAAVRMVTRDQAGEVWLEVHDDGPGLSREQKEHVFEPAFRESLGAPHFGLVAVRSAAEAFGGRIEIETSPLGGDSIRLCLPTATVRPS